ncbi:MAG TPA: ATP-dependent DNA helicase RecG [Erysipelothrix sp.]|nr:ATP-dependent DNA helicase RecG [Erysipelothrix sp.]
MKLTPKQNKILESFGYKEPIEFLRHYPYRYETLIPKPIEDWEEGELVIFKAEIISGFKTFRFGHNQSSTRFEVTYDDIPIKIVVYNQPFLRQSNYHENCVITGTVQKDGSILARAVSNKSLSSLVGIAPIYPLKKGIKQYEVKRLMKKIFKEAMIEDIVPSTFKKAYRLMSRKDALFQIHFPKTLKHKDLALRTLKYEEFLIFHLSNALDSTSKSIGIKKEYRPENLKQVIKTLPFSLTADQIIVLEEIMDDLNSTKQMHRLLQGDVGSGKTIVTFLSALMMIESGYQVAFMVPTEILLEQHEQSLNRFFKDISYTVLSSTIEDKTAKLEQIKKGEVDFVLGTHALFQKEVTFKNLGYVIIDEQHRFGVSQRQDLIHKGKAVDVLMLSATPIPRSLASSIYFDLDVSTIQTYPDHKKENKTILVNENSMRSIMEPILKRLEDNDQMYVVCPSIDDAQKYGYRNVLDIYEALKIPFKDYRLAYIHGQMKSEDKERVMAKFLQKDIDILVTTTIIEVGIDVPNANTMVIYNAEMFGLSTLHQLRGRIGRGDKAGVCYALSDKDNEEAKERLNHFASTNDGFKLSMLDLRMRGMGDILGERQSGLPNFVLGDIEQDQNILNQAKIDAKTILEDLSNADFQAIVNLSSKLKMVYN